VTSPAKTVQRYKARDKRRRDKMDDVVAGFARFGVGTLTAGLTSLLYTKFPRIESFDAEGKVQTAPIVSLPLEMAGIIVGDMGGAVICGVADSMWFPWVFNWTGRQTWAQPG